MKKKLAVGVAVLSGVYLFVPEPTDVIPLLGWLDEGLALAMLGWAMSTLGVNRLTLPARDQSRDQPGVAGAAGAAG